MRDVTAERTRRWRRSLLFGAAAVALGVIAALIVGCNDDDPETPSQPIAVTVLDDRVTPGDLRILAPDRYELTVTNDSSSVCDFSFGGLVRDLEVEPGGEETARFVTVDTDRNDRVEIGCGDQRTATAAIEAPGG